MSILPIVIFFNIIISMGPEAVGPMSNPITAFRQMSHMVNVSVIPVRESVVILPHNILQLQMKLYKNISVIVVHIDKNVMIICMKKLSINYIQNDISLHRKVYFT